MAKAFGGKRPQNLRHTLRRFGDYLGHHKRKLALIGVLTSISALAALIGTYMIRPAVNGILENGSLAYLAGVVAFTAFVYLIGALSTLATPSSWSARRSVSPRKSAATCLPTCRRCP